MPEDSKQELSARILRERATVGKMIDLFCQAHHEKLGAGLCDECTELLAYASQRLERCTFREDKPACSKCPVHCYRESMRARIQAVMRYAGPRMAYRHPVLAIQHMIDNRMAVRPSGKPNSATQEKTSQEP